jgi:hypothetical protein
MNPTDYILLTIPPEEGNIQFLKCVLVIIKDSGHSAENKR